MDLCSQCGSVPVLLTPNSHQPASSTVTEALASAANTLMGNSTTAAPGARRLTAEPATPSAVFDPAPMSMIDIAWGFNPGADRYTIALYRPNYLQVVRYSDRPNNVSFQELFDATQSPNAKLDLAEARFQFSLKARIWTAEDRHVGVWTAYTQQSPYCILLFQVDRR